VQVSVTATSDPSPAADEPLFLAFVNTLHWDDGTPLEELTDDRALAEWSGSMGMPTEALDAQLARFVSLRAHLRSVVQQLARAQAPAPHDMDAVEQALSGPRAHLVLVDGDTPSPHLSLEVEADSAAAIACGIALSLVRFLETGERRRLKLCANPGCGFAFLDTSTNNTRRWCDMSACGNRQKVRNFRSRAARTSRHSGT
jgi:predicted RNA-binding Zn ribbon-like protein